ncbi:heme ABC transporter ATP-binding protein [Polymorphum gilvum]|uniref:ABC transporter related protein n=1 Tax=Polymorphum gilvum (strain LMG 25793 / CGMCC 1.9160 / SL003B-26A1) TaxID=991905 RepID=F2IZW9_POLGS|nr:heme ABC transporter ATP-binding protein [Polymorphum gilvum]ADZ70695.1 ABC transporter related protein [Polymorphum gilvum SL003B-26A1]
MTRDAGLLETARLSVSIHGKRILHDIDLTARAGTLTAIVGPNGSGKSTLLKALSSELPFAGSARLNGRCIAASPPADMARRRAVLPQQSAINFPLTVTEVVRLGGEMVEPARLRQALDLVGLAGFGGRMYYDLSGGEQQRVQLARVLCQIWEPVADGEPRWLLLDEPVSSLDIHHQLLVMQLAAGYARAGGGVVAVMHDLNLTAMFAGHVLAMKNGRLAAAGTPAETLTTPVLSHVFSCALTVGAAPQRGEPFVLPHSVDLGALSYG